MLRKHNYLMVILGMLLCLSMTQCQMDIGQKSILTMADVKKLGPADLADFAISLYNKQADWYKDRISRWETLTADQQELAIKDYRLLCESWPIIDLYDTMVSNNQPVSTDTRLQIYRFIEKYLQGGN